MAAPLKSATPRNGRITLMVTQDVLKGVNSLAQMNNTSVNDLVCNILAEIVKKNSAAISVFEESKEESKKLIQSLFPDSDPAPDSTYNDNEIEVPF